MLLIEESPAFNASTEERDIIKSWRKEGASVRKCHKDLEMLAGNSKQKRLGERIRARSSFLGTDMADCTGVGLAGAEMGVGVFVGQRGRQMVLSLERHAKELNLTLKAMTHKIEYYDQLGFPPKTPLASV